MTTRTLVALALVPLLGLGLTSCGANSTPTGKAKTPPAKVLPGEADLTTIHLTAEAESRLGLTFAKVELRTMDRVRWLPGRVMLRPDAIVTVPAPLPGRLAAAADGALTIGKVVEQGAPLFLLTPIASADMRANLMLSRETTRGRLTQATTEQEAARLILDRAERMQRDGVGSARAVEEANTALQVATGTRQAAERELAAMDAVVRGLASDENDAIAINAERAATITAVLAFPGQLVVGGAPLVVLEDRQRAWLRVDVPLALCDQLDLDAPVRFCEPSSRDLDQATEARPAQAPPTADPLTASIVRLYDFEDANAAHAPGERCAVAVPCTAPDEQLVVATAAVLYDAYGGAWVYEHSAEHEYRRRRVDPARVQGGFVVLANGPAPGTEVVTDGAAELFGTEFGVGK